MNVRQIDAFWDRETRNDINFNFNFLFQSHRIIQTQLNDLVLQEGNSPLEVRQARGGEPVLNDRLIKFDSRLAQKADRSEVRLRSESIGLNDVASDLLAAIQNKEGETIFELSGTPRPGSVNVLSTDFIITSNNIFNEKSLRRGASINGTTGEIQASASYSAHEDYIPVIPNTAYTSISNARLLFHDETKKYNNAFIDVTDVTKPHTFITPDNCYFIRAHGPSVGYDSRPGQINKGASLLPYDRYFARFDDSKINLTFGTDNLEDGSVTYEKTDFIKKSTNLFNKQTETRGKAVTQAGEIVDNPSYNMSDWIEVEGATDYTLDGFNRIVFYDENKNYIGHGNSEVSWTVKSPSNARYALVHYQVITNRNLQLNKGNVLLPYEPFYIKLDDDISTSGGSGNTVTQLTIPVFFEVSGLNKENGLINNSAARDYETRRRTGKFLSVIPNTTFIVNFNKGKLFVFEYDSDFSPVGNREVTNGSPIILGSTTTFVKIMVENLTKRDVVSCTVTFRSQTPYPTWIKNKRIDANNISFTYEVNPTEGREVLVPDSTEEQYTKERYYNAGLLKLPPNYSPTGEPVKLIIWNNGAGGYPSFTSQSFNGAYEDYFRYLADEGYAMLGVYSWTTKYPETAQENFGSPITIAAFVQAYKWVIDNYNIDPTGAFIAGKSAGGYTGLNLTYNKGIPVLAAGLLAPAISPMQRPFGYDGPTRIAYAQDFGFVGDLESILGVPGDGIPRTQALKDLIINNADKLIGYNPYWNGLIGIDLDALAIYAAEDTEGDIEIFRNVARVSNVPTKIWVSEDDTSVSVDKIKAYLQTIKNGQGIGELRLMPNGTGKHNSVDNHPDALKVNSITTRLGITHTDVPLAYVEMLQFFRRFEN